MAAATSSDLDQIENELQVIVETSDETGNTHVYAYTDDSARLGFELYGMNPEIEDTRAVAEAIATLRRIANKMPRVGRVEVG